MTTLTDCRNPHLFVVGCLRSGTTMLQRMLDAHPALAVGYDSHFIPRPIERLPAGFDPPLTDELVAQATGHRRFGKLGLSADAVDAARRASSTYAEFVSRLYDAFARLHGKPLAGEKSPGYCRHLPHLHGLFPWAKTIHLFRDGRDIALSVLDWGKGPRKLELAQREPVGACALWWRRDVLAARGYGARLGASLYREVRYEDLVAAPEPALREIARFLELPYDDRMAHYYVGKTRPARTAKSSWLQPTAGLRDWRSQMSGRDVELFEELAGDALDALGYQRGAVTISPAVRAAAAECREWWQSSMDEPKSWDELEWIASAKSTTEDDAGRAAPRGERRPGHRRSARAGNPYVFFVGCPRSGTTLLKRIANAHRDLAVTPETHWIPRFHRRAIGVDREGRVTPDLVEALASHPKFPHLRIDRAQVEAIVAGRPEYATLVTRIFDLYGEAQGKRLVGDKTPGYVKEIDLLHRLWPRARFVHLVRDGRDVALSLLEWSRAARNVGRLPTWGDDPISTAAVWWRGMASRGIASLARLPRGLGCELRYEALIENPRRECERLCAFLDLEFDPSMLAFHQGKTRAEEGLSAKKAWLPPTPGLRDWRSQMSVDALERFEAVAGDLLGELGYERACPRPSPGARLHAEWIEASCARRPRQTDGHPLA
jgi:hypothetical protein